MAQTAAKRVQQLREHFAAKNKVLSAAFKPLSPIEFYQTLFNNDLDSPRLCIEEKTTYKLSSVDNLLAAGVFRSDLFVPPADFFNGCYRMATMSRLYALVLDLDYLLPSTVRRLIKEIRNQVILTPTLVLNSGSGVHVYYVFAEPVEAYKRRIPILRQMQGKLIDMYAGFGKVERHPLTQAYRICGSLTKLGDTSTGYSSGPVYDASALASKIGVNVSGWERIQLTMDNEQKAPQRRIKKAVTVIPHVNNGERFYRYCSRKIFRETDLGNRYMSLFGLAIVGYKTRFPKDEVIEDMQSLIDCWNEKYPDRPVSYSEIGKAMKGYGQDYVKVSAAQLEEYFGWSFQRKIPRRGRTQEEHLKRCRMVKDVLIPHDKKTALEKYLKQHPDATCREIQKALKMSPKTVVKYRHQILSN